MGELATVVSEAVALDSAATLSLRQFNDEQRQKNPANVAWPATLPIELALKTASPQELREHYGYTDEEWQALRQNATFMTELAAAVENMKKDGMSFRAKCKLQGEALLETNWRLIHAPHGEVPATVKQKLMEATWRMAGYDSKDTAAAGQGSQFNIQINLGG